MEAQQRDFIAYYDQLSDKVFRHCVIRVSDRDEALNITQETFTKVWDYMQSGKEIQNMKAFVFRITNNLIIDWYRKKKALHFENGEELRIPDDRHTYDPESAVDAEYAQNLLSVLDEPYRTAVSLRYIEELSPGEIADIVGETENTISVRVHRGIKQLQEYIEKPSKTSSRGKPRKTSSRGKQENNE